MTLSLILRNWLSCCNEAREALYHILATTTLHNKDILVSDRRLCWESAEAESLMLVMQFRTDLDRRLSIAELFQLDIRRLLSQPIAYRFHQQRV